MVVKVNIPTRFMFIGERRSKTAIRLDVTWKDGKLSASTLFKALLSCGVDPAECSFYNLWYDHDPDEMNVNTIRFAQTAMPEKPVVALGQKVSRALTDLGIRHLKMIHPAARGKIRTTREYQAHVRKLLGR